jgi:hypothetical protein
VHVQTRPALNGQCVAPNHCGTATQLQACRKYTNWAICNNLAMVFGNCAF